MKVTYIGFLVFIIIFTACKQSKKPEGGLPAQQALSTFRLPEGFKIELVASEPMISDPVAMDVDEYGNIYVVEMHGYPLNKNGAGVIKLLTDTGIYYQ